MRLKRWSDMRGSYGRRRSTVTLDELTVTRHGSRRRGEQFAQGFELLHHFGWVARISPRIVAFRPDQLADIHREPVIVLEQFVSLRHETSVAPEIRHFVLERVRNIHRGTITPQRRIGAFGRMIMQNDEVADTLE